MTIWHGKQDQAWPQKCCQKISDSCIDLAWRLNLHIFNKQCNYTVGWEKKKKKKKHPQYRNCTISSWHSKPMQWSLLSLYLSWVTVGTSEGGHVMLSSSGELEQSIKNKHCTAQVNFKLTDPESLTYTNLYGALLSAGTVPSFTPS